MKKIIILLLLLTLPTTSAITTTLKDSYLPSETITIEIQGNILSPIEKEDIVLKRLNVQVPIEYDVKRLGDKWFLYLIAPQSENNYTLYINNIETTVNGIPQTLGFQQNFSVVGELVPYTIKPGFLTEQDDYKLSITLNKDIPESIQISFPEEHSETLSPGSNTITINAANSEAGLYEVTLGIYTIPILVENKIPQEELNKEPNLVFIPEEIESVVFIEESLVYPVTIYNPSQVDIENIILDFDEELFVIEPNLIPVLHPRESFEFNLSLKKRNQPIEEFIIIEHPEFSAQLPVTVSYTENKEEVSTPYLTETRQLKYCAPPAKVCSSDEVCSEPTISTIDQPNCCPTECVPAKAKSSTGKIIGYLIAFVVLVILLIVGARYMKSRKIKEDPMKKKIKEAEEKSKDFPKVRHMP
jgi:hypothetical protein